MTFPPNFGIGYAGAGRMIGLSREAFPNDKGIDKYPT
jgi:hypothetical protein